MSIQNGSAWREQRRSVGRQGHGIGAMFKHTPGIQFPAGKHAFFNRDHIQLAGGGSAVALRAVDQNGNPQNIVDAFGAKNAGARGAFSFEQIDQRERAAGEKCVVILRCGFQKGPCIAAPLRGSQKAVVFLHKAPRCFPGGKPADALHC